VHRRPSLSLLLAALIALCAAPASAQFTRDAAANKKINEAINNHYLATDFKKAEDILLGTIQACQDKCSPQTLCKAWMYVGIVRGSGKNDQKGAQEAFVQAVTFDPSCKLDTALATPETQATYAKAGGAGAAPVEETKEKGGGKGKPPPTGAEQEVEGDMDCTPEVREVETRRSIPVSCVVPDDATSAELKYKEFGGDQWQTVKMKKKRDNFQAEVPCGATQMVGSLKLYVRAKDKSGDAVDSWGSKNKPVEIQLVQKSEAEPPSYPNEDAPKRCEEKGECPPDFPGCEQGKQRGDKAWGATCEDSMECQQGLICANGACEQAPSCDVDADCSQGKCVGGVCDPTADGGGAAGPYKKNWIGIHVAQDLAIVGGDDVCSPESQATNGFACFEQGTEVQYIGEPQRGTADKISTGVAPATTRFLLSYDRALFPNIMIGLRAGYAIGGGPAPGGGSPFLPIHAELRGSYWFGSNPLAKKGFRPYVHAGGGMAQVDSKLEVTVVDCSTDPNTGALLGAGDPLETQCLDKQRAPEPILQRKLDSYKKLGQGFATAGGGVVFAFKQNMGLQLNLNLMLLLPSSGFVIEPSLGFTLGI
jgi:hypothetical protein